MAAHERIERKRLIGEVDKLFIANQHQCNVTLDQERGFYSLSAECTICRHTYGVKRVSGTMLVQLLRVGVKRCRT